MKREGERRFVFAAIITPIGGLIIASMLLPSVIGSWLHVVALSPDRFMTFPSTTLSGLLLWAWPSVKEFRFVPFIVGAPALIVWTAKRSTQYPREIIWSLALAASASIAPHAWIHDLVPLLYAWFTVIMFSPASMLNPRFATLLFVNAMFIIGESPMADSFNELSHHFFYGGVVVGGVLIVLARGVRDSVPTGRLDAPP